jgi:hypothetical protein
MDTPIVSRRQGVYFARCAVCEKELRGKVVLYDRIDDEWFCDHECRADWYELQGKQMPPED